MADNNNYDYEQLYKDAHQEFNTIQGNRLLNSFAQLEQREQQVPVQHPEHPCNYLSRTLILEKRTVHRDSETLPGCRSTRASTSAQHDATRDRAAFRPPPQKPVRSPPPQKFRPTRLPRTHSLLAPQQLPQSGTTPSPAQQFPHPGQLPHS